MSIQFSVSVRNAKLNAIFATIGASAKMMLYTGSQPASCATASSGTLLATLTLPATEENTASSGVATQANGPWTGTASAAGTIGYFRIYDSSSTTCHMQGSVGQGTGDLSFDNPVVAVSQAININSFSLTEANA